MKSEGIEDIYDLSPMQQGLLFHTLYAPNSAVYCDQYSICLGGEMNIPVFERAWQEVINRHAVLRTSFYWEDLDHPLQVVHRTVRLPITSHDWREVSATEQQARLTSFLKKERERGFVLSEAPLMRLALIRLAEDVHQLVWVNHHLLIDGWSRFLLFKEVFAFYEAFRQGRNLSLPRTQRYRDYITWLRQQDLSAAKTFWQETLKGITAPTPLVVDKPLSRGSIVEESYEEAHIKLSIEVTKTLQTIARQHQLTMNTLVQGAWALLLHRYSDDDEVVFGATVSGRPATLGSVQAMVGVFINTLPVRISVRPDEQTLLVWLKQLQEQQLKMREYEYSPLTQIQEWSEIPRGQPLFQSILVFENYPVDSSLKENNGSLQIRNVEIIERTSYPLTLLAAQGQELLLKILHDCRRFEAATIKWMLGHLRTLLQAIADDPNQRLRDLPLLTPEEERLLLHEWNSTASPAPAAKCIHHLFETQAERTPEAVAVVNERQRLTYRELNEKANRLARYLRRQGIGPESKVGVMMGRGVEMVVAVLGVLKAGGAYVPLDAQYPVERLRYMVEDSGAGVVVTGGERCEWLAGSGVREVNVAAEGSVIEEERAEDVGSNAEGDNLAYVIYTSGSTGKPKGVAMSHRALCNLLGWQLQGWSGLPPFKTLQFASLSFDVSFQEIFSTWCSGGTLLLIDEQTRRDAMALLRLMNEAGVERAFLPFAVLQHLGEMIGESSLVPAGLREIISAGEQLQITPPIADWMKKSEGCLLENQYGPTEAHVVTAYRLKGDVTDWPMLPPIGGPISNVRVYVLDRHLRPTPVGVPGQLYLGGIALARGYINRPELTAEKFIPDPFSREEGGRLYTTGDVVRYLPDGNIEYLTRVDHQVKIRGFRIEPGEVEVVLAQHRSVKEAVVVVQAEEPSGDKRLVAYVVVEQEQAFDVKELRSFLKERLPDYMVPAAFVLLERLPLNRNGKVDHHALPAPGQTSYEGDAAPVKPRTPAEEILAGIWARVLNVKEVGIHNDFFDLGGHSLLATRIISRLREAFRLEIPLAVLFEAPTVAGLAKSIEAMLRAKHDAPPPIERVSREQNLPLSFAQQRLWFLDQLRPGNPAYNLAAAIRLFGHLDPAVLEQSFNHVVGRHESLRTVFAATDEEPIQIILAEMSLKLPVEDIVATPGNEREAVIRRLAVEEVERPFDLSKGPLLRVRLLRLSEQEHVLLMAIHHIISDAWSMGVLIHEVTTSYEGFSAGHTVSLPELDIQYADFAVWQRRWMREEVLKGQLLYWRRQLEGAAPLLELPTDWPRPKTQSFRGATHTFILPTALTESLKELSRGQGVTLFMTLLAAFQTLLGRCAPQDDVIVGADIANRNRKQTENIIGFFINMLVLRTDLSGNPSFLQLLKRVRQVCLDAYAHQDVPFEKLVEEMQPVRQLSHAPLFQVVFNFDNTWDQELKLNDVNLSLMAIEHELVRFDLSLYMKEHDDGLHGFWKYRTELFKASSISRMHEHFETLLRSIIEQPETPINSLEMLTEQEREQDSRRKQDMKATTFKKFKSVKPRPIEETEESLIEARPLRDGEKLPLVIQPRTEDIDLALWAKNNRTFIERQLLAHGALLFRGFHVDSLSGFSKFASASARELVDYSEPSSPRTKIEEKVYTSTEYPSDQRIDLHNEMSYSHNWPGRLFFFCVRSAEKGGETPIAYSSKVLELLDPKIRERFQLKKVMYVRNYGEGLGLTWQSVFHTLKRSVVEEYSRRARIELEWKGGDRLRTRQVRPAIAQHLATGETIWFNQAHAFHVSSLEPAVQESLWSIMQEEDFPNHAYYGDGSAIENSVIDEIREVYRQAAVMFPWREDDILMLDNMLVAHGREPFTGPRKIVVAMADSTTATHP